ncbi:MAG TPA: metal ABC transporter substrate-binding protein [Bacillota bacterium]
MRFPNPFKIAAVLATLVALAWLAAACGGTPADPAGQESGGGDEGRLSLITTYSIVYDFVREVAGERAEVTSLVPIGQDPHTYEPKPSDLQAVAGADAVFYHGLNLELWFDRFIQNAGGERPVYIVTEGIEPLTVEGGAYAGFPDPHAWMDPGLAIRYVENIRDALAELDPEGADIYAANAERYIGELEELDAWIRREVERIPAERRLLVTSENAFRYFARAYGFEILGYVYNLAPEDEPSARQISELVDSIRAAGLPAVFVETTLDPRILERISSESGAALGGTVYVDSLGPEGGEADTYIKMMRANVMRFVEGLGG